MFLDRQGIMRRDQPQPGIAAILDKGMHVARRHWPTGEETLNLAKAFRLQAFKLLRCFHALCRGDNVETGAKRRHGLNDGEVTRIGLDAQNESAVDLYLVVR